MKIETSTSYIELVTYNPDEDEIEIMVIPRSASVITNFDDEEET